MPRRPRSTGKADKDDLRNFQNFTGRFSDGDRSMPMRFNARIRDDGEVDLDLHAFRITKATWFVRERSQAGRDNVAEFALTGAIVDGLRFESDSLSFNSLGERWSGVHNRHWSKLQGGLGKVQYVRALMPRVSGQSSNFISRGRSGLFRPSNSRGAVPASATSRWRESASSSIHAIGI